MKFPLRFSFSSACVSQKAGSEGFTKVGCMIIARLEADKREDLAPLNLDSK